MLPLVENYYYAADLNVTFRRARRVSPMSEEPPRCVITTQYQHGSQRSKSVYESLFKSFSEVSKKIECTWTLYITRKCTQKCKNMLK